MSERKLATVVKISSINPIQGADRIEVARVRGWDVVVGKGQFSEGDLAVYFEIDSALPVDEPHFSFLAARGVKTMPDGTKVHVLRTVKLRKQISQGLLMTLGELPLNPAINWEEEGLNLTDELGIQKWEPPLPGGTSIKGNFPTQYASKTDSERVQNLSYKAWEQIQNHKWVATEKVDGTSITIIRDLEGKLIVCSRNYIVGEDSLHYNAAISQPWIENLQPGMAVQGEVAGPGIQGNPLQLTETRLFVFDIWVDRVPVGRGYWPHWAIENEVPIIEMDLPATIEEAVEQADGLMSCVNPDVMAEGLVWHTVDGSVPSALGRSTWKAINNSYLLR